jgi:hypothetical protein
LHPCFNHSKQRKSRKFNIRLTSQKESQRQELSFVLQPSLLKFEALQEERDSPCQLAFVSPPPRPEWLTSSCFRGARGILFLQGHAEARNSRRINELLLPPVLHARNIEQCHCGPALVQIPPLITLLGSARSSYSTSRKLAKCRLASLSSPQWMGSQLCSQLCSQLHECILRNWIELQLGSQFALI